MNNKKFAGLEALQTFLENCKQLFATKEEVENKADASHTHDTYETKEDAQLKYNAIDEDKKDKDLIVTFADSSKTTVTHTSQEIYEAIQNGTTVYFNNGGTNFNYLEGLSSVVNFYNCFYNNSVMQADVYEIRGNQITNNHFQNDIVTHDYVDTSISDLKDDLLNGAGDAYDTLQELGILIDENHGAIDALEIVAANKSDKDHTHTMESIEGLQDAVNAAADSKFYVVTFARGSDGEYHGDLTFAEIRAKFEAGGNMVARIDGTDYIPLLSAASHQVIFSGIYQSQSVSLTINSSDVCVLTTTSLSNSNHIHTDYETKTDSASKLTEAKTYTDDAVSQKSLVQMITWEADD